MACQWRASGLHIVIQWRAVASFEFLKTRMKLNLRSLYMADGNATAELLQVSTLLQQAIASASSEKLPETTSCSITGSGSRLEQRYTTIWPQNAASGENETWLLRQTLTLSRLRIWLERVLIVCCKQFLRLSSNSIAARRMKNVLSITHEK
ncbi:uncharacterized protein LOC9650149 isoform X2 [Selaginella moellendorffii]|uniref:uncharacterized protein LOC9650149 isoform X2 n=1 Tax=Selaginella moellendorffii TaxID=88036 RepID=UPI000D1C6272|nr:uncharacterized protein LOC9650149 isoform X2 [Selaginella moellendorffii]|eukprot:XP_024532673.1 uncharacterized protein LOC9650149 isoform X2 [Selaginella moellendorffii]